MVDELQAGTVQIVHGLDRQKIDVVDAAHAITVDQINEAVADAPDRGNIELHGSGRGGPRGSAQFKRSLERLGRILDAKAHGTDRAAVIAGKLLGKTVGLGVDQE